MNRRGFLQSILAAGVAPSVVGSGILMPVRKLWTPPADVLTLEKLKWAVNQMKVRAVAGDYCYLMGRRMMIYDGDKWLDLTTVAS